MCEDCFDDDHDEDAAPRFAREELIDAARMVEADMPGTPVSEDMWEIFFGARGGSIDWPSFERMARSREAALVLLAAARGDLAA